MNDFSPKVGKVWKGAVASLAAALKYVIIPLIVITIVASLAGEYISDYLEAARNAALFIGVPLIVVSFFKGFYPRGSQSRLVFALVTTALVCLWIWFILHGGIFEFNAEQVTMTVDYSLLVLLFILVVVLRGVFYAGEYFSYRKEYLSEELKDKEDRKREGTASISQSGPDQSTPEVGVDMKATEEKKE